MEELLKEGYVAKEEGAIVVATTNYKIGDVVWHNFKMCYISSIELIVEASGSIIAYYRIRSSGSIKDASQTVTESQIRLVDVDGVMEKDVAEYHYTKATYEYFKAKYHSGL